MRLYSLIRKIAEHPVISIFLLFAGIFSATYSALDPVKEKRPSTLLSHCSTVPSNNGDDAILSCSPPPGRIPEIDVSSPREMRHRQICFDSGLMGEVCATVPDSKSILGGKNSELKQLRKEIKDCLRLGVIAAYGSCTDYEKAISNLAEAPLAYNRPTSMFRGEREEIILVLDISPEGDPTLPLDGLRGEVTTATTKFARHMSAELRGVDFEIEPSGPQSRLVTGAAPVKWSWSVIPIEEGDAQLITLDIHAHIQDGDTVSQPINIRTFRDEIIVQVKTWDRIADTAALVKPIHAFIVAICASVWGVFVWWKRRRWRIGNEEGGKGAE